MADAASYDNGQYTPWDESGGAAVTSTAAEETWDAATPTAKEEAWPTTTTSESWDDATSATAAPTTSMSPAWSASSSPVAWSVSSSRTTTPGPTSPSATTTTTTAPSSSSVPSSAAASSSTTSTTPAPVASSSVAPSSALSISSAADKFATVSRYTNPAGTALASSGSTANGPTFNITYLIPVIVGLPIIACFALAACTYGKWWGRDKRRMQTPFSDGIGGAGAWWGGAGGGSWGSRRSRRDAEAEAEETGGLVEGKWAGGADDYDEKRSSSPVKGAGGASRWSGFFGGGAGKSGPVEDRPDVPFLSISHAPPMQHEAPFVPPTRSSSTHDFPRWGQVAPRAPSGEHLTAGAWSAKRPSQGWINRSSSVRSTSSRLSDKIRSRFNAGSAPLVADCPSPSVYSPNVEAGNMGSMGAYMGLHSTLEDDAEEPVDYDALLGAARVGDGHLAQQYAKGEVTDAQLFPPRAEQQQSFPGSDARERYYARHGPFAQPYRDSPPAFAVDLPTAPSRLQVSPKKSATVLSRPAPESPERTTTADLLFSYESPARTLPTPVSRRPPLPPAPRVPPARAPTSGPLTDAPARGPFRQQAPPQVGRPVSRSAAPPSPEARADLFFSGAPAGASSSGHDRVGRAMGAPMPAGEPGRVGPSELAYSLGDGVDALASERKSAPGGRSAPSKEPSSGARTRRTEVEQLKRARTDASPAAATAQQQPGKAPKGTSRGGAGVTTPTKARPLSAYAQLPSQQERELGVSEAATNRQDRGVLRPSKSTMQPSGSRPRASLGFDPVFGETPALAPLQHPSKVRAAIETIETRAPAPDKAQQHRKTASHDLSASSAKLGAPQRLERSTTTAAAPTTTYRRPLGRKGLDTDSDESDDDEAIATKRRVSMLILNRSRSQSGAGSSDSHESTSVEEEARQARPLSSDPRRLSKMLRRGSSGANLAAMVDEM
ncbi:hypothetical protein JCM3770_007284 [Rhodotorula araucariae]